MLNRRLFLLVFFAMLLSIQICFGENIQSIQIIPDEWAWDPGAINSFRGELDLSDYKGKEIKIHLNTDLPTDDESDTDNTPVFTTINGKRITVLKQSDTVLFSPDKDLSIFCFTGQIRLPKKHRVREIRFSMKIYDGDENELGMFESSIRFADTGFGRSEGSFYIPINIRVITLSLITVAILIWFAAVCRNIIVRKKLKNGR